MGSMILIRGVSGSGKTCFVEEFLVNNRNLYIKGDISEGKHGSADKPVSSRF